MKKIISLILVQLLIFIVIGEIVTRIFFPAPEPPNTSHYETLVPDQKFGWLPKENFVYQDSIYSADWEHRYYTKYESTKYGFRFFGDTSTDTLKRLLVIGDSYTQAPEVANDKTYYSILKDSLGVELFAFGAAGYGSLQQLMILEKYIEEINPDVVLLQLSTNDLNDNNYDLERQSIYNTRKRKPYWINSKIAYRDPGGGKLYKFLNKNSSLFYNLYQLGDKMLRRMGVIKLGEEWMTQKGLDHIPFRDAAETSEILLGKIKKVVEPDAKIVSFLAENYEPQYSVLKEKVENNSIQFTAENIIRMNKAKTDGKVVFCYDQFHWNELGHQIIAQSLLDAVDWEDLFGE